MALYAQLSRPADYCDVQGTNPAVSDIAAGLVVQIDATAYSSAPDPYPVKVIGTGDATTVAFGVTTETLKASSANYGRVCVRGFVIATAGTGGVTVNDLVVLDSAAGKEGRVKTLADAVAHVGQCIGKAFSSGADGDPIVICLSGGACTTA